MEIDFSCLFHLWTLETVHHTYFGRSYLCWSLEGLGEVLKWNHTTAQFSGVKEREWIAG